MPLYEYKCEACGNRFEKIQKFSDPPVHDCPNCGKESRRLVSSPAFQFKGSGWYITDYARSGKPSGDAGEGAAAKATDKSTSDSTSSTPSTSGSSTSTDTTKDSKKDSKATSPAKAD